MSPISRRFRLWPLVSALVTLAGVASLVVGGIFFWLAFFGADDESFGSGPETVTAFGPGLDDILTPRSTDVAPTQPVPTSPPNTSPVTRILIPKFGVDANVVALGLDAQGVMEAPDGPWAAAWYDFTSPPGAGSNAVFSGHIDWYNTGAGGGPGPAVFWHLKDLEVGDLIEVRLKDGTVYTYRTISRRQVFPDEVNVQALVGPAQREIITLITCGGTFNFATRHYDQRVIVQAERVAKRPS
ncbi:MAG: class F sortase [Dehalococcoidia bacterium]